MRRSKVLCEAKPNAFRESHFLHKKSPAEAGLLSLSSSDTD
jgi:hypothetical protein